MRFFLFSAFVLHFACLRAQIGMGQWRMHIPTSQAIDVAAGNGLVMAALKGGVIEYDVAASENRILNKLNALSDVEVSCIVFEPQTLSFLIGYENGNMDLISSSGAITNIPAVKLAQVTASKRINKMIPFNGKIYVATGFSVVIVDPSRQEVSDTYYPTNGNESINDVAFANDSVYVLTNTHLFRGSQNNLFLSDPAQWITDPRLPEPTDAHYGELDREANDLYFSYIKDGYGGDSIMRLTPSGSERFIGDLFAMEIKRFHVEDGLFYVYYPNAMIGYNKNLSVNFAIDVYGGEVADPRMVIPYDNIQWVADGTRGLVRYSTTSYGATFLQPEGPPKNSYFSLNGHDGKIIVTGGVIDGVNFEYNLSGAYTFEDESWKLYDKENQTNWSDAQVWDIGIAAINPKDPEQMAVAGYCIDALSLIQGDQVTDVFSASNSILDPTSLGNGNVCMSDAAFDDDGNLWMLNCFTNEPLKVRLADGTWQQFDTGGETKSQYTTKLTIDYNGNKWFGSNNVGLIGYNDNKTPANAEDDTYKLLKSGEGLGNLPSNVVTALAVDFDNEIWIGTDQGFAVLYNSNGVFDAGAGDFDASRILITFEGNVENLLGNVHITDIEVDGGNRKWIATASTGIFLLSANGQEVIRQLTAENSPLISNNIMDMEFNHMTGELFIVTDLGLVSYRTDASYEDKDYSSVSVFPNPVKPDYFGPVTIQGIRYDSDVRITDAAGNLVYQTTSNGGTATWNGKTLDGLDVSSGVYIIWTATNTNKNKKVGKVVVIR